MKIIFDIPRGMEPKDARLLWAGLERFYSSNTDDRNMYNTRPSIDWDKEMSFLMDYKGNVEILCTDIENKKHKTGMVIKIGHGKDVDIWDKLEEK